MRTYNLHRRKVRETFILTGEISEDNMGPETKGVQDNLHGGNITTVTIRSSGLERSAK